MIWFGLIVLLSWGSVRSLSISHYLRVRGPGNSESEGTSFDVLVIEPESQGKLSFLVYSVNKIICSVLIVEYLPVRHATIWSTHLEGDITTLFIHVW